MPYQGQIAELTAAIGTLTSDNSSPRARSIDLIEAEGVTLENGVFEREPGATPYSTAGLQALSPSFTFTLAKVFGASMVASTVRLSGTFNHYGKLAESSHIPQLLALAPGYYGSVSDVPDGAIIAVSWVRSTGTGLSAITDTQGNTYTKLGSAAFSAGEVELWVALNVTGLTSMDSITLDKGTPGGIAIAVVNVFTGGYAIDETVTTIAAPGAVGITQAVPFNPVDTSEGVIIAYGDTENAYGVNPVHSEFVSLGSTTGLGIATATFYGTTPFGTVACNALQDYWTDSGTQRLLAVGSDGVLYKSSGGAFSPLTMATTMDDDASMIVLGGQEEAGRARKALVFDNGHTKIQVLSGDGASTTNFGNNWNTSTNIPADWATNPPRGGIIHKERLWCWSPSNAPHNIYASKLRDHENFKNAVGGSLEYVQEIGTGTGLRIAAAASFKGMLFVFKYPRGIWYLDDTDVDYLNWRWNQVTDAIGVADSPYSVIVIDDDILFMGADGHLHFLSAITQQGVRTSDLTVALNLQDWTAQNIGVTQLSRMASCWYPAKKLAMFGVPTLASGAANNDLRLFLDFSTATEEGSTVRISYSHRDINRCLSVRRDSAAGGPERPIFGDDNGTVWKMDQSSKSKTGFPNAGLGATYQYVPTDFSEVDGSLANKRKIFDALTIIFDPVGNYTLNVDTFIDGEYHETLHFVMGDDGATLGSFVLGSDRLGGGSIQTVRRRMTGHGYWLSLAGRISGDGQDFSVQRHFVNFRPGGEEQR